ncbi:methionine synthase II (cobalamin-independent) [Allocatelliglobosispora scoriae]|uniref:Methionine synthase II (Cobalamin-independent) n=1 Tax=Allocatelliglobosispora scoriae TaxID=643052 RepID=A0A841BQU6_9ACTN|nr:methionine synthase [Allocatelliglobosispora scoriae]MBB5869758.1 methionine synthase II (cobalamin-independent) [Allocatelliglobosispora scoriae]
MARWPRASATGIGSLPGLDIVDAVKLVADELPDLPYLPELPNRGIGADMIGRSAAVLIDMPVELYVSRWQIASRPGKDLRRALDLWDRDLDALTEQFAGYAGPLKLQIAGPWTLAASLQLPIGGALLRDHGAVRDLAVSLAEGMRLHVADVRRRVPGAEILLQVDEPSLPAAMAGQIKTESGLGTLRVVTADRASETLRTLIEAVGAPVILHCCAADPPIEIAVRSGAAAIAVDLSLVKDLDPLGEAIEAGLDVIAGVAPTTGPPKPAAKLAEEVEQVWRHLGFPKAMLPERVAVAPTCGLAGATPSAAKAITISCREAAQRLSDD